MFKVDLGNCRKIFRFNFHKKSVLLVGLLGGIIPLTPFVSAHPLYVGARVGPVLGVAFTNAGYGLARLSGVAFRNASGYYSAISTNFSLISVLISPLLILGRLAASGGSFIGDGAIKSASLCLHYNLRFVNNTIPHRALKSLIELAGAKDGNTLRLASRAFARLPLVGQSIASVIRIFDRAWQSLQNPALEANWYAKLVWSNYVLLLATFLFVILGLNIYKLYKIVVCLTRLLRIKVERALSYRLFDYVENCMARLKNQVNTDVRNYDPTDADRQYMDYAARYKTGPANTLESSFSHEFQFLLKDLGRAIRQIDAQKRSRLPGVLFNFEAINWDAINSQRATASVGYIWKYPTTLDALLQFKTRTPPGRELITLHQQGIIDQIRAVRAQGHTIYATNLMPFLQPCSETATSTVREIVKRLERSVILTIVEQVHNPEDGEKLRLITRPIETTPLRPSHWTEANYRLQNSDLLLGVTRQLSREELVTIDRLASFEFNTSQALNSWVSLYKGCRRPPGRSVMPLIKSMIQGSAPVTTDYMTVEAKVRQLKTLPFLLISKYTDPKVNPVWSTLKKGYLRIEESHEQPLNPRIIVAYYPLNLLNTLRAHAKDDQALSRIGRIRYANEAFISVAEYYQKISNPFAFLEQYADRIGLSPDGRLVQTLPHLTRYHTNFALSSIWRVQDTYEVPLTNFEDVSKCFKALLEFQVIGPVTMHSATQPTLQIDPVLVHRGYARFVTKEEADRLAFLTINRQHMHHRVRFLAKRAHFQCLTRQGLRRLHDQLCSQITAFRELQASIINSRMAQLWPKIEEGRKLKKAMVDKLIHQIHKQCTFYYPPGFGNLRIPLFRPFVHMPDELNYELTRQEIAQLEELEALETKFLIEKKMQQLLRQTCMDAAGHCNIIQEAYSRLIRKQALLLDVLLKISEDYHRNLETTRAEVATLAQLLRTRQTADVLRRVELIPRIMQARQQIRDLQDQARNLLLRKRLILENSGFFPHAEIEVDRPMNEIQTELANLFKPEMAAIRFSVVALRVGEPHDLESQRQLHQDCATRLWKRYGDREHYLEQSRFSNMTDADLTTLIDLVLKERKKVINTHLNTPLNIDADEPIVAPGRIGDNTINTDMEGMYAQIRRLTDILHYAVFERHSRGRQAENQ